MAAGDLALHILIDANGSSAQGVIGNVGRSLSMLASSPMAAIAVGAAAGAAALIGIGVAATKSAADFQTAMLSNVAHAGLAKSQFDSVSQSVLAMSTEVGRSPTQLAEALYPILSAFSGIQNQSAKSAIALDTLKMSFETVAGTTVDGTAVANAAVGTFNALGLATNNVSENTQRMTGLFDVMDKTVQLGNMQWDAYKNVVSKLAVAIQGTGISFNESQAALATMTNEGFSAQRASTYLSNTFTTLAIKTDALSAHAKKLGIDFDAAKYGPMSLADKIAYLNQITDGNKQKLLALMGNNSTALKTFNALSVGVDAYKSNLDALNHSQGALKTSFDEASKGFNFQMEKMKAAGSALMITLGTALLPTLSKIVGAIAPIVASFTDWLNKSHALQNGISFLGGVIHQIVDAFNAVFGSVQKAIVVVKPLTDSFDRASGIFHNVTTAAKPLLDTFDRAHGIISSTAKVVQPMTDSFDRATGVFNKTAPAAHSVVQAVNPFIAIFQGIANVIRFFITVYTTVSSIIQASIPVFRMIWSVMQQIGSFLVSTFTPVWKQLVTSFREIQQAIQPIMPQIRQFAQLLGGVLAVAVVLIISIIAGLISAFAGLLTGVAKTVTGIIQFFAGLVQFVSGVVSFISDLLTGHFDKLAGDLNNIMQGIMHMFIGVWNTIEGIFSIAFGIINGFASGFVSAIIAIFQDFANQIVGHSIIPDMINSIVSWFQQLPGRAIGAVQSLAGQLVGFFSGLASQAVSWGSNIIQGLINGINSMIGNVSNAVGNIASIIGSFLPHSPAKRGELSHLNEYGPALVMGIANGITRTQPLLHSTMSNLVSPMGGLVKGSGGGNAFALSGSNGNAFALGNGGQTIIVQVQPAKADINLDKRKVGEGVMHYASREIRIQGTVRNK